MVEKPSTLFLIVAAGLGSAILSTFTVEGVPVAVLVIPMALLASYLYNAQEGMVVGAASSIVTGILVASVGMWTTVIYAIGSVAAVFALETFYPKQKNKLYFILFAGIGALVVEILNDVYTGNSLLLRPEHFFGTNPASGIRAIISILATAVVFSLYENNVAPAKK